MTREEAIRLLQEVDADGYPCSYEPQKTIMAIQMAIQALSQEPTENLHKEREQAYMQGYEDASKRFRQEPCRVKNELKVELNELEPCDDAISRDAVLDALHEADMNAYDEKSLLNGIREAVNVLPSVNFQPCEERRSRWKIDLS